MARRWMLMWIWMWLGAAAAAGQEKPKEQAPAEPPEEDESLAPKQYAFNPLQAAKELQVGKFYFKKGSYKAAAGRFEEAVKWDPGLAEAYLRLAETREKLKEAAAARAAYARYLEVAPDAKNAAEVKRKLSSKNP